MRAAVTFIVSFVLLPTPVQAVQPLAAEDARIKALGSQDGGARARASEELVSAGAAAVAPLLAVMDKDERTAGKTAYETLFRITQQAAGTKRGPEVAGELARELGGKHSVSTRRSICRLLSFVAGDESVDALYKAMNTKDLAEMARWALARIPTRRATEALIGALQITELKEKIAVINSLGERGDKRAVRALQGRAAHRSPAVRAAALDALAMIPVPESLETIAGAVKKKQTGAAAAMLTFGETLLDAGLSRSAGEAFRTLSDSSSLTVAERCRLLHGRGRVGGKQAIPFVLTALDDESPHVRGAAVQACAMLPGEDATAAIAKKMAGARGLLKADLLDALGHRGSAMDEGSAELIVAEAESSKDESVRVAAIRAIEKAGIDSGVPVLLKLLAGPESPTRDAAEHAINHMPGQGVTEQIAGAVGGAAPPTRAMLILALGHRGGPAALEVVTKAAKNDDVSVRAAAFKAIGVLKAEAGFDALLAGFKGQPGPDREAAEKAMRQLEGDAVTVKMLAAYQRVSEDQKPSLLRVIGWRKHADVPPLLSREANNPSADIRAAAVEGLGRQDDPAVAPTLLKVARGGPANVTEAALAGYLRAARRLEGKDRLDAGHMYVQAIRLAAADDQKREALNGITRNVNPGNEAVLPLLVPHLRQGNVRSEAARAVAPFAMHLPESRKSEAIELLRQVVKLSPGNDTTRKAVEHLRKLGVDIDPARDAGFITEWWVIGPFPNPGNEMFSKAYFPEREVDLQAKRELAGKEYAWKQSHTADLRGIIDLEQVVARKDNVGAYGYAEITVDAACDVVLKIGSDDSIVVWINGEQVHAWSGSRGVRVDQDQARARLEAGVNKILVKCLNGGSDWAYCVRVTTPGGEPVAFK